MNAKQAYNGLRAVHRSLATKYTKLVDKYGVLKDKHAVLASQDPVLAALVDENHRLTVDLRTLSAEAERLQENAKYDARLINEARALFVKQRQETRKQQRTTLYWACAFAVQAVASVSIGAYLWLV